MLKYCIRKKVKSEEGQAMVEFAIVLPLLLMILCGIIDFGWLFYNQLNVDNASREAARAVCVECASSSYDEVVEQAKEVALGNIYSPDTLPEEGGVTVEYLNNSGEVIGVNEGVNAKMVRVTVKIDMPVLTFVLHAIARGDTREVSSSTTFKVETRREVETTAP